VFDPATLRPFGKADESDPYDLIYDRSGPATGWPGRRTLKLSVRRAALRELGSVEEIRSALAANPEREATPLQRIFERAVDGDIADLLRLPFADLLELGQLYDWGLDKLVPLPSLEDLREAQRRRVAVARFDHLVDRTFTGREGDLQVLRDHVGVVSTSAWSRLRAFFSEESRPPLFISGVGGAGKTALLGRFLIEHVEAPPSGWFPFAYVPFDSDAIDVREPFTLLIEVAGQLAAQVAHAASDESRAKMDAAVTQFRNSVSAYRDARGSHANRASVFVSQKDRLLSLDQHETLLTGEFAVLLRAISREAETQQSAKSVPVLLVFDTFEEVIYRAREDLVGFWHLLDRLSWQFPPLRVVIAGARRSGSGHTDRPARTCPWRSQPDRGCEPPRNVRRGPARARQGNRAAGRRQSAHSAPRGAGRRG
jgi:hypothetical protein